MSINKRFNFLGGEIHIQTGDDAIIEDEHAQLQNQIEYLMTLPDWDASTIAAGLIEAGYER